MAMCVDETRAHPTFNETCAIGRITFIAGRKHTQNFSARVAFNNAIFDGRSGIGKQELCTDSVHSTKVCIFCGMKIKRCNRVRFSNWGIFANRTVHFLSPD
jgi:hypothetical protein